MVSSEKNDTGLPYHFLQSGNSFRFEDVKILEHEKDTAKRKVLEAMHISLNSNTCNLNDGKWFDKNWLDALKFLSNAQ